jgi:hypothetical protein
MNSDRNTINITRQRLLANESIIPSQEKNFEHNTDALREVAKAQKVQLQQFNVVGAIRHEDDTTFFHEGTERRWKPQAMEKF